MEKRIWLITGISGGLGKALCDAVIGHGDFVIGTFRNPEQAAEFSSEQSGKAIGLALDLAKPAEIEKAFAGIIYRFGRIDVLVNNAGVGIAGAIEETSMAEARALFEINFFGTLLATQLALPVLRKQKSGHIIQISSHGGFKAFPGFGIYNASKFALEGFSEALAAEVAPLGIRLTIVEPGPFRTRFAGDSLIQAGSVIDDYQATAGAFRQRMKQVDGKQEGDPQKAAKAILDIANMDKPPLRLPLGKIAVVSLTSKLDSVQKDLNDFRELAESAVYL
ncbi:MAG: SDR family NAD(P)-dependent oxidoreductase [Chitinophagaceae bacterium]|nr:SDR family NAD(P)-dependent oxidoreductase [Chitinophagaceae bacterium]